LVFDFIGLIVLDDSIKMVKNLLDVYWYLLGVYYPGLFLSISILIFSIDVFDMSDIFNLF
jgi:hypothetical protein